MISELQNLKKCEDLLSAKIYWLNRLSGELSKLNIITDYVRSSSYSGKTGFIDFELPDGLSQAVVKLAKGSNFSIYLLLLSALKILLNKYTGNQDIIVGSPAWRDQSGDSQDLIHEIIPLRSQVTNQQNFKDFLLQVQDTTIDAYIHQNYSFDELIRLLKLPQDENRHPLCDVIILLENIHELNPRLDIPNDLTFSFVVAGNQIRGKVEYNKSLFQGRTIDILVRHYISVIECAIADVNVRISDIVFLNAFERQQVLEKFNDNAITYPVHRTIHSLFEQQVEKNPHRIAAVCEETRFTYQELNEKANRIARFLKSLGIKKGEFVGILKERDVDFSVAILSILKVGGVYVPIDSAYPIERIQYMVSDSEVKVLLTNSSLLSILTSLPEGGSDLKSIICLDSQANSTERTELVGVTIYTPLDFERFPRENLEEINKGVDLAYMLYTSGSTGLPKGAMIRHGGAVNHIYAQFDALVLNEALSFLQSAPASSDISVWQFLAPLLIGGRTVIVDTEAVCNPEKLFSILKNEKVTLVEFVPVVLRGLLDYISSLSTDERALPDLTWMMVTGESVSVELVNQWLLLYPSIPVVNAYGPTEAADDITQFIVEKALPHNQRTVPIGKPLANLNLYVLDSQMQVVPIGVPGEICVSGFGVGEGYWKNEEKTNASFVPNPFPGTAKLLPGAKGDLIYKTGDLGRWLPDGNIEFLERIDHQVKIRGFRIELGEIEAVLSQHSSVRETVVVTQNDEFGKLLLVAYIVAKVKPTPTTSELHRFLKAKLPDYMLPSAFVVLEGLPLAPSGKVDHKALPQPESLRPRLETAYVMPQTEVERTIAQIWQMVLKVEKVGIQDNFFELGGHSLRLLQVYGKLREQFKKDFSLTDMFQYPTISALSEYLVQQEESKADFQEKPEFNEKLEAGKSRLKQRLARRKQMSL